MKPESYPINVNSNLDFPHYLNSQMLKSELVKYERFLSMPALDIYHNLVKQILIKADWKITHDPFPLKWKKRNLSVDLGAEKLLAAEKEKQKIVVEVKSFLRESRIADLQQALGQYILYQDILKEMFTDRQLYLAIPLTAYVELFEGDKFAQILLDNKRLTLIIFDPIKEEISQWIY